MSIEKYAVYIIVYHGDKLPPKTKNSIISPRRYIGSSKLSNILDNNYLGSVTSKKYSKTWLNETKINPSLFKIRILSIHETDILAREEEKRLQIKHSVVKSSLYVNLAIASPNGYFGKPDTGRKFSEETKIKMANVRKGRTYEEIYGEEKAKELKEKRILQVPYNKGKKTDQIYVEKAKASRKGLFFITNGIIDRKIKDEKYIPDGWRKGRTNGVRNSKNTAFIKEETKEKIRKTKLKRYGDENYNGSSKKMLTPN